MYIDDLNFDPQDFKRKLKKPKLWNDYKAYWMILFIAGVTSLVGVLFFSVIKNTWKYWTSAISIYFLIIISFVRYLKKNE